jgi:hypothetical protein
MKSWEELSRKEQLAATHYDFYKDVHGIRPRWMNYDAMSEQELEQELEQLSREAKVQQAEDAEREKIAIEKFERHVVNTMCMGARDRDTALRWIMDASEAAGDWEYFCFLNGLPYGYFRQAA